MLFCPSYHLAGAYLLPLDVEYLLSYSFVVVSCILLELEIMSQPVELMIKWMIQLFYK